MSRLDDRLRIIEAAQNQQRMQAMAQNENQQYIPDTQAFVPELSREYDYNQRVAQDNYQAQSDASDITNPHKMYKEIIKNPSPRGSYPIRVMGRPIDVNALEQYLIFKISPRTITTLMRYNDAKSIEEIKGYTKRFTGKGRKSGLGMILLISIGAIGMILVGYLFLNGTIPNLLQSFMGGMM